MSNRKTTIHVTVNNTNQYPPRLFAQEEGRGAYNPTQIFSSIFGNVLVKIINK